MERARLTRNCWQHPEGTQVGMGMGMEWGWGWSGRHRREGRSRGVMRDRGGGQGNTKRGGEGWKNRQGRDTIVWILNGLGEGYSTNVP